MHYDRLAVDALADNVERLPRTADPVLLAGVLISVSTRSDNVLARELPYAYGPNNVPNCDRAGGIDGERVYAVAKRGCPHETWRPDKDKVRCGRERLSFRNDFTRLKFSALPAQPSRRSTSTRTTYSGPSRP